MRTSSTSALPRRIFTILGALLIMALLLAGFFLRQNDPPARFPTTPARAEGQIPPSAAPTLYVPSDTPTPITLQAATLITPTSILKLTLEANVDLSEKSAVNVSQALQTIRFAPTGDKLLYLKVGGDLYCSNLDGTDATFIHGYGTEVSQIFLSDQRPLGNTLFVPGYALHFTAGQDTQISPAPATIGMWQIQWLSPARATGITYDSTVGNDHLVTLDEMGNPLSSLTVPYMESGAVQPGGGWLAYATGQQSTFVPFKDATPQTIYLLNLKTGRRLQLTQPGMGWQVFSWSPDGKWIYASAIVGSDLRGVLISADGLQQIVVTQPGVSGRDAVWSPDSTRLAFSVVYSNCDVGLAPCPQDTSKLFIANISALKISQVNSMQNADKTATELVSPRWSPDGSLLALLSFAPDCATSAICSGTTPAFYLLNAPPK